MNNQGLIKQLIFDLRKYSNMKSDLYLQKCEALRTLYVREKDFSHALGINLEMRKKINISLTNQSLMVNERKRLLKKYWQTYLFSAPYDFHSG